MIFAMFPSASAEIVSRDHRQKKGLLLQGKEGLQKLWKEERRSFLKKRTKKLLCL